MSSPFVNKDWINFSTTPLDAPALEDMEIRLAAWTDETANALVISGPSADINMTSAATTNLLSGSFTADATTIEVLVRVHALNTNQFAGYTGLVFFYGTIAQPVWADNQAADRPSTARVNLGGLSDSPGTEIYRFKLTGLTKGQVYNFSVAGGIIGYATTAVTTTDALSFLSISSQSSISTDIGDFGDAIIAATSAQNRLHLIRSNHWVRIDDEFITGAGITLTSGRGAGGCAISPNRKRVLVPHFSLGKATVYDLANLSQPTVIGADLTVMAGAYAPVFLPDNDTVWVADFGQALPHVQKITGVSTASATVAGAIALDTVAAGNIQRLYATPDGTKIVCCGGTGIVYVVNTSTNAVSKFATPASANANALAVLSNTQVLVHYGTSSVAIMDLTTGTFGTAFTGAASAPLAMAAYKDGFSAWCMKNSSAADNLFQINLPVNSGNAAPNEFTHFNQGGAPQDIVIDDRGNLYIVTNSPNTIICYYGSMFLCRPSGSGQALGEGIQVSLRPAH